jgi:hypothetical protein
MALKLPPENIRVVSVGVGVYCHRYPLTEKLLQIGLSLRKRLRAALPKNIQLPEVVFEQVGSHLGLFERIADPHGRYPVEQNVAQLVHRLRVYLQRLLQ